MTAVSIILIASYAARLSLGMLLESHPPATGLLARLLCPHFCPRILPLILLRCPAKLIERRHSRDLLATKPDDDMRLPIGVPVVMFPIRYSTLRRRFFGLIFLLDLAL